MMGINSSELTRGSVAPVHQLVLPFDDGSQLCRPVTVLLLVHEEINTLPHQILFSFTEHVLVSSICSTDERPWAAPDRRGRARCVGRVAHAQTKSGMQENTMPGTKAQTLTEHNGRTCFCSILIRSSLYIFDSFDR